jgi:pimeloyl-ACP methyl ester carboxylesterase
MDIVLIAGLWLDGSVWDEVVVELEARGHRGITVTLPGQGDGSTSATLSDQSAAVVAAVDAAAGKPMVAGHSAACNLAWLAADARPEKISQVALIGGFPELARAKAVSLIDIDSGHWPMVSAPAELARVLSQAAEGS